MAAQRQTGAHASGQVLAQAPQILAIVSNLQDNVNEIQRTAAVDTADVKRQLGTLKTNTDSLRGILTTHVGAFDQHLDEVGRRFTALDREAAALGERFHPVSRHLEQLREALATLRRDLTPLEMRVAHIDRIDQDVRSVKESVNQVAGRFTAVDTHISSVANQLTSVEGKINHMELQLNSLQENIRPMDQRFGDIEHRVDQVNNRLQLGVIEPISQRFESLDQKFATFSQQTHLDHQFDSIEQRFVELQNNFNHNLDTRVTELRQSIRARQERRRSPKRVKIVCTIL